MANPVTRTAQKITQRSGTYFGKGMLTAELLIGFAIILIRIVADFEVDDETGSARGNVLHPSGTYGPFPIAVGLIGVFFVLSFFAASGGTKAKLAVIFGGLVVLALGVNSAGAIDIIATSLGSIGSVTVPAASTTVESSDVSGEGNPDINITVPSSQSTGTGPIGSANNPAPTPTGSNTANPDAQYVEAPASEPSATTTHASSNANTGNLYPGQDTGIPGVGPEVGSLLGPFRNLF